LPGPSPPVQQEEHGRQSGEANVAAHEGSEVWGVLYTISDDDLKKLDKGKGEELPSCAQTFRQRFLLIAARSQEE
jgi:hypothetical protein